MGRPEQSILFLEKVFLKRRRPEPLRGVELFNLLLVRDLQRAGMRVTLPVDRSWAGVVQAELGESSPEIASLHGLGRDLVNGILCALRLAGRRFDALLLGNVGNGIVPAIKILRWREAFPRCVLIAHREATSRFVRLMRKLPGHVIAVNAVIARPFREAGCPSVHVDYGIMDAERFFPAGSPRASGRVRFCVMGALDNAWKGADTAVRAFRLLPGDVRDRCELHLYAFANPPAFPEANIRAYPWIPLDEIPGRLREMDVMIVPSRDEGVMRETFSQAMVQGMLTGLPVVVSDRPVLAEKLDAGGGFVCENETGMSEAMARLATDRDLRLQLGAAARRTALARYVWDTGRFISRYLGQT